MDSIAQCDKALEYLRNARAKLPPGTQFTEGEIGFAYETARNAIVLAEAHIRQCRIEWSTCPACNCVIVEPHDCQRVD